MVGSLATCELNNDKIDVTRRRSTSQGNGMVGRSFSVMLIEKGPSVLETLLIYGNRYDFFF
jgi:hypothetical protein